MLEMNPSASQESYHSVSNDTFRGAETWHQYNEKIAWLACFILAQRIICQDESSVSYSGFPSP